MEAGSKQPFSIGRMINRAGIYTTGEVLRTVIPTLLLPILTYYLAPDDYGIVASFQALAAFTLSFSGLSTSRAAAWRYLTLPKDDMAVYVGNCLLITAISTIVLLGLALFAGTSISEITKFPSNWLIVIPILCAADFIWRLVLGQWRALEQALQFSLYNILLSATNTGLSLFFVIVLALNWQGRILGICFADVGFAIVALIILRATGYLKLSFNRGYITDALAFSIPIIIQSIAIWVQSSSSRLFLNNMVGLAATGLYSVGYTLASVISLVVMAFHNAWMPWLYRCLKENDQKIRIKIVLFTYTYFIVVLIAAFALAYIGPLAAKLILDKRYVGAGDFIFWVGIAFAFQGMQLMMHGYIFFANRNGLIAKVSIVVGLLSLGANYALIRLNGPIGAAQAMAIVFFIGFLLTWIVANSVHPMPWFSALRFGKQRRQPE